MTETHKLHEEASRWERRKERTHRRLLEAADELFLSKGFAATTVEEVAAMADVAKGTFFNYFESKEALLVALLTKHINTVVEDIPGVGQPALARARLLLQKIWMVFLPYQRLAHRLLTYNMARPMPGCTPPIAQVLSQILREGQEQGTIRADVDVEIAAMFIAMHFFRACMNAGADEGDHTLQGTQFLDQGLHIVARGISNSPETAWDSTGSGALL